MNFLIKYKYIFGVLYVYFLLLGYWHTPVNIYNEPVLVNISMIEKQNYLSEVDTYIEKLQYLDADEQKSMNDLSNGKTTDSSVIPFVTDQKEKLKKILEEFNDIIPPDDLKIMHNTFINCLETRIEVANLGIEAFSSGEINKFNQYNKMRKMYSQKYIAMNNMFSRLQTK